MRVSPDIKHFERDQGLSVALGILIGIDIALILSSHWLVVLGATLACVCIAYAVYEDWKHRQEGHIR